MGRASIWLVGLLLQKRLNRSNKQFKYLYDFDHFEINSTQYEQLGGY